MSKFIFLINSKSSIYIFLSFFISKILNMFVKRKIINSKKNHQLLLKEKKITNDFFSAHSYNFFYYLNKLKPNFNYLEIGSYEGNSAIFVAKQFNLSKCHCVDNWVGNDEYIDHINFSSIESNFNFNVDGYKNIYKIKSLSDDFFFKNTQMFDAIYVDGYHLGSQVYKDCLNSWNCLNKGGFLICDDYIWNFYPDFKDNPCFAINSFLKTIKGFYKLEKVSNSQIFIKKK